MHIVPNIITYESEQFVRVRKYDVDILKLQSVLKEQKQILKLTIRDISDDLGVTKTTVKHWFRTDSCFSIQDENIWFELKKLLQIKSNEFDKSITEFIIKQGVFENNGRN